jgi:transcription initiation factor TFIIB
MSNQFSYINNIKSLNTCVEYSNNINDYVNKITQIYNNNNNGNIIEIKKDIIIKKTNAEDIINEFYCKRCKENSIIEDSVHGIMVCTKCSIVKSNIINCTSDWNNYNDGKKEKSRSCHPISALLPQSSTATVISGSCSNRIKTLHNWNNMPYKERILNETFKIIQDICTIANIPKCVEDDAKIRFKQISDCKHMSGKNLGKSVIIRGQNRKSLIAECFNEACNFKGLNRPPKEIQKLFGTKHTKGRKIYQDLMASKNIHVKINFPKPDNFIIRFCDNLNLKTFFKNQSLQIAHNVQKIKIASVHNSLSIATGSVFLMSQINNLNITKKQISDYFYVSQVTISKTYHKIEPFAKILINDEMSNIIKKEIEKYQKDIIIDDSIDFLRFNVNGEKLINFNKNNLITVLKNDNIEYDKIFKQDVIILIKRCELNNLFMSKKMNIINNFYEESIKNIKNHKFFKFSN